MSAEPGSSAAPTDTQPPCSAHQGCFTVRKEALGTESMAALLQF